MAWIQTESVKKSGLGAATGGALTLLNANTLGVTLFQITSSTDVMGGAERSVRTSMRVSGAGPVGPSSSLPHPKPKARVAQSRRIVVSLFISRPPGKTKLRCFL